MADIVVKNIDVDLLREQRDWLLETFEAGTNENADGLVNMLDYMLDEVEEYKCDHSFIDGDNDGQQVCRFCGCDADE